LKEGGEKCTHFNDSRKETKNKGGSNLWGRVREGENGRIKIRGKGKRKTSETKLIQKKRWDGGKMKGGDLLRREERFLNTGGRGCPAQL